MLTTAITAMAWCVLRLVSAETKPEGGHDVWRTVGRFLHAIICVVGCIGVARVVGW
jgi:hypothetical protein